MNAPNPTYNIPENTIESLGSAFMIHLSSFPFLQLLDS